MRIANINTNIVLIFHIDTTSITSNIVSYYDNAVTDLIYLLHELEKM